MLSLEICFACSVEISNVSNAPIGLQSQEAHDQDMGGLKMTKIKSKQSKHTSHMFSLFGRELMEISDTCTNGRFR